MARHAIRGDRFDDRAIRSFESSLRFPDAGSLGSREPWRITRGDNQAKRRRLALVADQVLREEGGFPFPDDILAGVVEAERFTTRALAQSITEAGSAPL
jgi:hypothetical protein